MSATASANSGFRPLLLGAIRAPMVTTRSDGSMLIESCEPLGSYPERITDRLEYWASIDPERICAAQRDEQGQWRKLSYGQLLASCKRIGAALLTRNLSVERPIMILSGNDLEQLELTLAAMWVGVPVAPVSPAYSLLSSDFAKLQYLLDLMTPGMVYASDAAQFERALKKVPATTEIVVARNDAAGHYTPFTALDEPAAAALDEAHAKVAADTIAKFLFTSGSTKQPKAVPNTQRMLCSNQQMLQQTFAFATVTPPVLVDWLPWHHTFGGNHNLNLVIYNGGTLYIDDGKPTPAMIGHTLRNLAEIAPTIYFNVPKGWEDIAHVMRHDHALRDRFFSRVEMLFYAGAGLSQATWNLVDELAIASVGKKIRMLAGLGMTETAPSAMFCFSASARSGEVGIPVPGCRVKLAPVDGKLEARFSGPNVMTGYWRTPELNHGVFDDEGFFCTGDALKPMDSAEPERGFLFDGRLAEDFKLSSGTFVSVGPLRARVIAAGAPLIQDVVLAGLNRDQLVAIIFPRADLCIRLAKEQGELGATLAEALASKAVRGAFEAALTKVNQQATGSATRIERAVVSVEPPSMDRGEVTDKGSINQRAVLSHRSALVDSMYAGTADGMMVFAAMEKIIKNQEMVRD